MKRDEINMLVFMIDNKQQEYSKCFSIINFIKTGVAFDFGDFPIKTMLINNQEITNMGIYDFSEVYNRCQKDMFSCVKNNTDITKIMLNYYEGDVSYCFFVINTEEGDVLNFHYFDLIRRNYESNCYLLIEPKDDKDYYRISDFYQIESTIDKESYSHRFCKAKIEGNYRIVRFAKKNNYTSRSFLPLLRTEMDAYKLLSQSIFETLSYNQLFVSEYSPNDENQSKTIRNAVLDFCKKLTSEIINKSSKINWNNYKEQLSQISVLGYCYFVSYLFVSVNDKEYTINPCNINSLILQAEDFANGTMQLFENALKHSKHGYFCYRMHCTSDKKSYLIENYDIKSIRNGIGYYLEVLISDYNSVFDIPKKFIHNLKTNKNYGIEKELIESFEKKLNLKDFFNPTVECVPFWKEYYSKKTNIALHYGLNIFEQIVISSGGHFVVYSSSNTVLDTEKCYGVINKDINKYTVFHIPGTQYRIILPIKNDLPNQNSTGLKINLDSSKLKHEWVQHTIRFIERGTCISKEEKTDYIEYSDFKYSDPNYKEQSVIKLADILYKKTFELGKYDIAVFDVNRLKSSLYNETFAKAFICLLSNKNLEHVAIINASHSFISMFIRVFGLLFYKKITRDFLFNNEIYICSDFSLGSDTYSEIIFKGDDIRTSVNLSKRMADYKGEYPVELSIMENISSKCEKQKSKRSVKVLPFDILVKEKCKTLFQNKTQIDLSQNIQKNSFGCRLSNVHMKVGSKIHITDCFYEATLLFGIDNYISRFAVLLANSIKKQVKKNDKDNIILIGYETYSEMLIVETKNMLKKLYGIKSEYYIYEDPIKLQKFRGTSEIKNLDTDNAKFVIIVPIGSTLTTHDKILADLRRELNLKNNKNILAHLCVVLIRDKENGLVCTPNEHDYWSNINDTKVTLSKNYDIGADNEVEYTVSVGNEWTNPNRCKFCFPDLLTEEKPILKVNKASVVPMIMIGIKENPEYIEPYNNTNMIRGNVQDLKDCLRFGHFCRGDNHFEYYFMTEKLCKKIVNDSNYIKWMKSVKEELKVKKNQGDTVQYDFVVSPQHKTNAEFILMINEHVFNNPASVIMIDVKKEYRDNIKTKFSYLTQLYSNLRSYGRKAVINFHYVDDTITTGASFNKCKSFIQSLFPQEALSNSGHVGIKVNVFSSVIILLARCSRDTKRSYVSDGRFFNYYELNISALRNYEDACVLCKKYDEYKEMRRLSATNSLEREFFKKMTEKQIKSYNELITCVDESGYDRMFVTNDLNIRLNELNCKKNDDEIVTKLLLDYMNEMLIKEEENDSQNRKALLINTFLNTISSPFLIFRKSFLTASFKLLLNIACYLIIDNYRTYNENIGDELSKLIECLESQQNKDELKKFIKAVFNGLSKLGSNILLRVKTINAFFEYVQKSFCYDTGSYNEWIIFYCTCVKQTLMLNKQDSRVFWLEKVLTTRMENYNDEALNKNNIQLNHLLFLENNLILSDTLNEGVGTIQNCILQNKEELFRKIEMESEKYNFSEEEINTFLGISEDTKTDLVVRILFSKKGELRYNSILRARLKETIQAYFCEAFREFSKVDVENETIDTVAQLLDMSIMYLLLLPNSSLFGERKEHLKFYNILMNQMKKVLRVNMIQLFMCREDTIDFICSSDNNNNEMKPDYFSFINCCKTQEDNLIVVGETYYYNQAKGIAAIKIVNNTVVKHDSYELSNIKKTSWFIVFDVQPMASIKRLLKNARNLLVMREALLMRFKKDYDNNLYEEFSDLRKKVRKLTDDKAGGHTPFAELSQDFDYLYAQSLVKKNDSDITIANQMKLITDLLISKLYVGHINEDRYPEQIEDRYDDLQYCTLSDYKSIIEHSKNLILRRENSIEIKPEIAFRVDWNKSFTFMKKSAFIWISIFYSLIMNALRHGLAEDKNKNIYYVSIDVSTDNKYLIIRNKYNFNAKSDKKNGITLETIKAFLAHYGFCFSENRYGGEFFAKIPLERGADYEKSSVN